MNKFHAGWYLFYTRPRHEKKVLSGLAKMEINSFLPTKKSIRNWHDRKKIIDEPLFPSYVFIYFQSTRDYFTGLGIEGVLYCVRSGKELARVNESVINNIRLVTEQDSEVEVSSERFRPGQRMVIREGALTGLFGEMVQCNGHQKILIRVQLLQRSLLVTLPSEYAISASAV